MDIACPQCGETESLRGTRSQDGIALLCEACGHAWNRDLTPSCKQCGSTDMQAVPLAILEKGRGTQLSVVGTRTIHLCSICDAPALQRYHDNRPNPLMPDDIPTAGLH
jgi:ribosomal protein L37AE/L43A